MSNAELKKMEKHRITIVLDHTPDTLSFGRKVLGAKIIAMRRGDAIRELNEFEEIAEGQD